MKHLTDDQLKDAIDREIAALAASAKANATAKAQFDALMAEAVRRIGERAPHADTLAHCRDACR